MKMRYNLSRAACGAITAALAILNVTPAKAQDTATGRPSAPTLKIVAQETESKARSAGPTQLLNQPAPEFALPMVDGGQFDLAAQRGKAIVLLDFWATWCGPCRKAMPTLVEVARDYADKQVRYFAVNLREKPSVIQAYLEKEKLKIQVPLDQDGKVAERYGVRGIPTMVIIDRAGVVRQVHIGASPNLKATLQQNLDDLLAQKDAAKADAP